MGASTTGSLTRANLACGNCPAGRSGMYRARSSPIWTIAVSSSSPTSAAGLARTSLLTHTSKFRMEAADPTSGQCATRPRHRWGCDSTYDEHSEPASRFRLEARQRLQRVQSVLQGSLVYSADRSGHRDPHPRHRSCTRADSREVLLLFHLRHADRASNGAHSQLDRIPLRRPISAFNLFPLLGRTPYH